MIETPLFAGYVLIVDDYPDSAASLGMLLRFRGFSSILAYNGQAALDLAEKYRPFAILLDIGMPEKNGFVVAQELRERSWATDVLIVAVTARCDDAHRQAAMKSGFNHFIGKPIMDIDSVVELLMEHVPRGGSRR